MVNVRTGESPRVGTSNDRASPRSVSLHWLTSRFRPLCPQPSLCHTICVCVEHSLRTPGTKGHHVVSPCRNRPLNCSTMGPKSMVKGACWLANLAGMEGCSEASSGEAHVDKGTKEDMRNGKSAPGPIDIWFVRHEGQ